MKYLAKLNNETTLKLISEFYAHKKNAYDFIVKLQTNQYDHYFESKENLIIEDSKLELPEIEILSVEKKDTMENSFQFGKTLFEILNKSSFPLRNGNDKSFWMYLSLYVYRGFALNTANYNSKSTWNIIREHLFFESSTGASNYSNLISRCWWAFQRTYREDLEDPYKYTKILMSNSQIFFDISERKDIYCNKTLIESILEYSDEKVNNTKISASKITRGISPSILNHLKNFSLDNFSKDEIKEILDGFHENLVSEGFIKV